jgi:phosphatidylglycerol:prolipoprotein diacylglycerol transferase
MVPYIHIPDLHIPVPVPSSLFPPSFTVWPLPLHPFGMLVATGVLIGTAVTTRRARFLGYDLITLNSFITWMLVSGFVLSHMLDMIFYHWDEVVRRPISVVLIWEGLSSFGGFVGAFIGIVLWKYFEVENNPSGIPIPRWRAKPYPILPFADLVLSVFPIAWIFGRAGCASVHDHIGAQAPPGTWIAVTKPCTAHPQCCPYEMVANSAQDLACKAAGQFGHRDPGMTKIGFIELMHGHDLRFDLGFLEMLFTIVLATCFVLTWRRKLPVGTYVIASALAYAPIRFAMDFLRIPDTDGGDTRYAGLTPAQYGCMALFLYGVAMIFVVRRIQSRGVDPAAAVRVPPEPGPTGGSAKDSP